jgi:HTH-type transcriptional regulator / antitoxin HipB
LAARRSGSSDPEPLRELAAAIRRRRKDLGLTQVELGRFAGSGPVFVYDVEAGKPTVRLSKLVDLLSVLGLELRLVEGRSGLSVDPPLRAPTEDEGVAP